MSAAKARRRGFKLLSQHEITKAFEQHWSRHNASEGTNEGGSANKLSVSGGKQSQAGRIRKCRRAGTGS